MLSQVCDKVKGTDRSGRNGAYGELKRRGRGEEVENRVSLPQIGSDIYVEHSASYHTLSWYRSKRTLIDEALIHIYINLNAA